MVAEMKYRLISIDDSIVEAEQSVVTVWCEPSWLDSLMGVRPEYVAFTGRAGQWQNLERESATPHECRFLHQMWSQHRTSSLTTNAG
ncbi:hypothetical protein RISK_002388 [Rhodopirellula islandica]|uniref:Uncharacterized protein n=1 Tax=Rhodopirellula islandica TaxID=595434 RepID=A0A0J1BGV4_RHOIS|nr:hypothetical protein RISK_002388 [Rhodopirellula islandica]